MLYNSYDENNNLIRVSDSYGLDEIREYDSSNNLVHSISKELGKVFSEHIWSYNDFGLLDYYSNLSDSEEYFEKYEYDSNKKLIQKYDSFGYSIEYEYNSFGNEIYSIDSEGKSIESHFDTDHRLINRKFSSGEQYQYEYDTQGNLIHIIILVDVPMEANSTKSGEVEIHIPEKSKQEKWYKYDLNGNLIEFKDSNGFVTVCEYNGNNDRIHRISNGEEEWYSYEYDKEGRILRIECYREETYMILNDTDKYKKMAVIDSSIDCEDTSNLTTKISEQYDVERYIPEPIDTSDVNLSNELLELTELIAENVHETWALSRILEGWVYGIHKDDSLKTTPCLVPYKELPDSEKEYDRKTALETLKLVIKLGYKITK